jgi:hypothetical protein
VSILVIAAGFEMANAAYALGPLDGWQVTTSTALGYLPEILGVSTGAVPFLALVLIGWHRASQVAPEGGAPVLHVRHFQFAGWTELLFWCFVASGAGSILGVAIGASRLASSAEVWWILGGVLQGLGILLVGGAGVVVSRRLTRHWINAHVGARGGLPAVQPTA